MESVGGLPEPAETLLSLPVPASCRELEEKVLATERDLQVQMAALRVTSQRDPSPAPEIAARAASGTQQQHAGAIAGLAAAERPRTAASAMISRPAFSDSVGIASPTAAPPSKAPEPPTVTSKPVGLARTRSTSSADHSAAVGPELQLRRSSTANHRGDPPSSRSVLSPGSAAAEAHRQQQRPRDSPGGPAEGGGSPSTNSGSLSAPRQNRASRLRAAQGAAVR